MGAGFVDLGWVELGALLTLYCTLHEHACTLRRYLRMLRECTFYAGACLSLIEPLTADLY